MQRRAGAFAALVLALSLGLPAARPALAHGVAGAAGEVRHTAFPDVELLDQNGAPVRFYSDLVRERVVAMSFVFTTCSVTCPLLGFNFAQLEKLLAKRVGREVHLLSISVDPATDTPSRLAAWAARFDAGPGWTQLTGSPRNVYTVLEALEVFTADRTEHSSFILIGNDRSGTWKRLDGLSPADVLLHEIELLLAGR